MSNISQHSTISPPAAVKQSNVLSAFDNFGRPTSRQKGDSTNKIRNNRKEAAVPAMGGRFFAWSAIKT
ncbi:hypothetical protein [Trichococcus ilyis]|uniref:hypothetical protein n=1 Tax=Trichococcus ilyis TaxID=640938 RepID=UPI00083907CD|nr:hypothetical protein [Trichococcus ilyis]